MYSRIGCCIKYCDLSKEQKSRIIDKWYDNIINRLTEQDKKIIDNTNILQWFKDNADRFDNIRLLKTRLENAIFDELADVLIKED